MKIGGIHPRSDLGLPDLVAWSPRGQEQQAGWSLALRGSAQANMRKNSMRSINWLSIMQGMERIEE
jgi:hypothetical protein